MTDRLQAVTVAFATDIRDDDAEAIISAIKQLRGVIAVTPHVVDVNDFVTRARIRHEMFDAIWGLVLSDGSTKT